MVVAGDSDGRRRSGAFTDRTARDRVEQVTNMLFSLRESVKRESAARRTIEHEIHETKSVLREDHDKWLAILSRVKELEAASNMEDKLNAFSEQFGGILQRAWRVYLFCLFLRCQTKPGPEAAAAAAAGELSGAAGCGVRAGLRPSETARAKGWTDALLCCGV
jgi:hypothetical protein